jgi:hypothetical protein
MDFRKEEYLVLKLMPEGPNRLTNTHKYLLEGFIMLLHSVIWYGHSLPDSCLFNHKVGHWSAQPLHAEVTLRRQSRTTHSALSDNAKSVYSLRNVTMHPICLQYVIELED